MAAIFFDIDGTLWDKENFIPQSTKDAIRQLRENGHQTFLCSGRTRVFINSEELLGMGFDGIVCGCGTFIEYEGKELLYKAIDRELLKKTVQTFYDYDIAMVIEGRYKLYMDADVISRDAYGRYLLEAMKDCILPIRGNEGQLEASKFSVLIHDRDYQAVMELLKDDYDFMVHGDVAMEVVPKGYSKASGIACVCEKLGLDVKDTYAFGDSANDLDMLDFAGVGVAMGNGTDVAKAHADYVTKDLHEDGIYHALRHFELI